MPNPENKSGSDAPRPRRHRDAQDALPDKANLEHPAPGEFAPVQPLSSIAGPLQVPWESNQPTGIYPSEAGSPPPPLAQYADTSGARAPDPGPTNSPPAPVNGIEHPHFAARKKG